MKLKREDGVSKAVDPVLYQSMIGGLLYAAIATRPDISQAVGVSKYSSKPSDGLEGRTEQHFRFLDYQGSKF